MRQLHAVSIKERFVASGVYTWAQGGVILPVREAWTIHELPDQSQIIRVDREEKSESGVTLLLEILRDAAGQIDRFDAHFYGGLDRSIRQAKATFTFFEERVQLGRTVDNGARQNDELTLAAGTLVYPNAYVLLGSVLADVVTAGQAAKVFSFGLEDHTLFMPQVDPCAVFAADADLPLAGPAEDFLPGVYQMVYRNYDKNTRFWLDKYRTIVKMEAVESDAMTVMTLNSYSRRPDTDHD